ncbi:MAG: hypothetical protein HYX93_05085, partial [Chloroflexi bacterium]|nr:hypothetical protein [Chloroflexota bacterium]
MEENSERMQAQAQRGKDLAYLTVFPGDYDPNLEYPLIIMLHGFGANMYDLADLASVIESRGYLYLCPNAPIPVQVGPGMLGFAWTRPGDDNPEQAQRTEQKLEGFLGEAMEQYPAAQGRSLLLGFSQGGGLTYRFGLPRPDRFAALVALS